MLRRLQGFLLSETQLRVWVSTARCILEYSTLQQYLEISAQQLLPAATR